MPSSTQYARKWASKAPGKTTPKDRGSGFLGWATGVSCPTAGAVVCQSFLPETRSKRGASTTGLHLCEPASGPASTESQCLLDLLKLDDDPELVGGIALQDA